MSRQYRSEKYFEVIRQGLNKLEYASNTNLESRLLKSEIELAIEDLKSQLELITKHLQDENQTH